MSGGAYEYVAAFNKDYTGDYFTDASCLPASGTHFATTNGRSDAYKTAYSNNTATYEGKLAYTVSKVGDGIKEVYTGESKVSWHRDYAYFVSSRTYPFFARGGDCVGISGGVGTFCSSVNPGSEAYYRSFCVVLCP